MNKRTLQRLMGFGLLFLSGIIIGIASVAHTDATAAVFFAPMGFFFATSKRVWVL